MLSLVFSKELSGTMCPHSSKCQRATIGMASTRSARSSKCMAPAFPQTTWHDEITSIAFAAAVAGSNQQSSPNREPPIEFIQSQSRVRGQFKNWNSNFGARRRVIALATSARKRTEASVNAAITCFSSGPPTSVGARTTSNCEASGAGTTDITCSSLKTSSPESPASVKLSVSETWPQSCRVFRSDFLGVLLLLNIGSWPPSSRIGGLLK
jgi:hypothetical protein